MKHVILLLAGVLLATWAQAQTPEKPLSGYTYKVEPGLPGKQVYISGQRPYNAKGELVGAGSLSVQTRQVFENLKAALSSVGMSLRDVTQVTYHLKGTSGIVNAQASQQLASVGAIYFPMGAPKLSATKSIPKIVAEDVLIEVEVVAVK